MTDSDDRDYEREEIRFAIKLAILGGDVPYMALVHTYFNASISGESFDNNRAKWLDSCLPTIDSFCTPRPQDEIEERLGELDTMSEHIARLQAHLVIVQRDIARQKANLF
jgi:1,2-phenylacetyl-CoA epoxidase catalytic subunit